MNDSELKDYLLATHPVLPGQEQRAWQALRSRLAPQAVVGPSAFAFSISRLVSGVLAAVVIVAVVFELGMAVRPVHHGLAFADSQVPGIYATSFYSHSAHAQVVWLNGMEPVTDRLTYLDPTTVIKHTVPARGSVRDDPDQL